MAHIFPTIGWPSSCCQSDAATAYHGHGVLSKTISRQYQVSPWNLPLIICHSPSYLSYLGVSDVCRSCRATLGTHHGWIIWLMAPPCRMCTAGQPDLTGHCRLILVMGICRGRQLQAGDTFLGLRLSNSHGQQPAMRDRNQMGSLEFYRFLRSVLHVPVISCPCLASGLTA